MNILKRIKNSIVFRSKKIVIVFQGFLSGVKERREISRFLFHIKGLVMYPYEYTKKYNFRTINVMWDTDGYPFVLHSEKKLYLKKGWSKEKCQKYYNNLRIEQDEKCTHKYLVDSLRYPDKDDVAADLGAAEGIFGLDIIDNVKELYLFECDEDWNEPLRKTFLPWKDKVIIVNKYLSDSTHDNYVTLDDFFNGKKVTYIKADIEGNEIRMLQGAVRLLESEIKKAFICIYHNSGDESKIKKIMEDSGFCIKINSGYLLMTNVDNIFQNQYLRHGVLFAYKE